MSGWLKAVGALVSKYAEEYFKDYRESMARFYDYEMKTNAQLNQIILTVSVATLTAVAALNERVFVPFGALTFGVILVFVVDILFSVANLYFSALIIGAMRRQMKSNLVSLKRLDKDMAYEKYVRSQKILNITILSLFCLGLLMFLILLGLYILGGAR